MAAPAPFVHGRYRLCFQAAGRGARAFLVDRETVAGWDELADGLIGTVRARPDPADHRRQHWSATLIDSWTLGATDDQPGIVDLDPAGPGWSTPQAAAAALCDALERRRAPQQLALPLTPPGIGATGPQPT